MSGLRCARCDVELFDDPHTDTDLADVCDLCCTVCNPSSESSPPDSDAPADYSPVGANPPSGSQSPEVSPATGDAVAHDEAARIPAGSQSRPSVIGSNPTVLLSAGQDGQMPERLGVFTATETARQSLATTPGHDQEGTS